VGVFAALLFITVSASSLTLLTSTLLLWRYRRSISRLGSAAAARETGQATSPVARFIRSAPHGSLLPEAMTASPLYRQMMSESRRNACKYAAAGVPFGLLIGVSAFVAFSQTQINFLNAGTDPLYFVFLFWTFVWPFFVTTAIVGGWSPRKRWSILAGYFAVLVILAGALVWVPTEAPVQVGNVILPGWSGETPIRLGTKWSLNLVPTLLLAVFRHRRLRAVAPLVLGFMTTVSAGLIGIIAAALVYRDISVTVIVLLSQALSMTVRRAEIAYFLLLLVTGCLLFGAFGWALLVWVRRSYQRKTVSDQSLGIDAVWMVYATFYGAILAVGGPGWPRQRWPPFSHRES
jgi:hypothetical protein